MHRWLTIGLLMFGLAHGVRAQTCTPWGPFHFPLALKATYPFTLAFRVPDTPETLQSLLDSAATSGMHLLINLAGSRSTFRNPDGSFSLTLFRQRLERFSGIDLKAYVTQGVLIGHLLFDEPHDPNNWDGRTLPASVIDSAAAISKALWPEVPVGVGAPASFLAQGAPYAYLDFGMAQYTRKRGDASIWVDAELAAAGDASLQMILSINVLSGGEGAGPMSATDLETAGTAILNRPEILGMLLWKWEATYFASADVQQVLHRLSSVACQATGSAGEDAGQSVLQHYPNPAEGQIWLSGVPPGGGRVRLYDMLGRLQGAFVLPHYVSSVALPLPSMPAGRYLLDIHLADGRRYRRMFMRR